MTISNPYFGEIELELADSTYIRADVSLNGRTSNAHVFIDEAVSRNPDLLAKAIEVMEKLDSLDLRSRKILSDALLQGNSTVIDFIDFHLEELPALLDPHHIRSGTEPVDRHRFLEQLDWQGIGLHAEDEQLSFVMDYMMDRNVTDEILCVKYVGDGNFTYIAHES